MKLQFLNSLSLDIISGGNIYNKAVIEGLRQKNIKVDYNKYVLDKDYDITIIDSFCMNNIDISSLKTNKQIIALIHQIPRLQNDVLSFYKTHSKFIVTGEPTKLELIKHWQLDENNITIIRPGISEHWVQKKVFNDNPKRILLVSNYIQNKGFETLTSILNRLNHLDLEFHIVGNNTLDEAYANNIIKTIQSTSKNVTFHFNLNREEVYNQLIKSDVFLSLSKSESFGMSLFEALSMNLPSISYKTGDYNYFSRFTNYIKLNDYSENGFVEIIEEWVNNSKTFKSYCANSFQNKRNWNHVIDEFSMHLKNSIVA